MKKGIKRDQAHFMVQRVSDLLQPGESFLDKVLEDAEISQHLSKRDVSQEKYIEELKQSISSIIEKNL